MLRSAPIDQGGMPPAPSPSNTPVFEGGLRARFLGAAQHSEDNNGSTFYFEGPFLSQADMLALQSGHHDSFGVHNIGHAHNASGTMNGDKSPEAEKNEKAKFYNLARGFSMGGIEFTTSKALQNMGMLADRYRAQIEGNSQSLTISEQQLARYADGTQVATTEELETYIANRPDCLVVELYAADQVTLQDGELIRIDELHDIEQQNEILAAAIEEIEFYQVKVEEGEMDISELPETLQQAILDVELETLDAMAAETQPLTVLDMLVELEDNVEATIQDVIPVTPTVTFSPM